MLRDSFDEILRVRCRQRHLIYRVLWPGLMCDGAVKNRSFDLAIRSTGHNFEKVAFRSNWGGRQGHEVQRRSERPAQLCSAPDRS